jgi:uncharacterized membrane protein
MDIGAKQILIVLLFVTHYLSIAVWVGVMLFNLIVNFPAVRSRTKTQCEFAAAMSAQGTRAAPWLYTLIALTALSGGLLTVLREAPATPISHHLLVAKVTSLVLMLALHLYGTLRIWPYIHFALDHELPALFFKYQMAMTGSTILGILAITMSYLRRVL